jgi:hypothetical protein
MNKMVNSEQAIEKAFSFLQGLKPEYLGSKPENIRLETIQRFNGEWVVVLSYLISLPKRTESTAEGNLLSKFLEGLSSRRYIKEFEINAETGELVAMRNPEAHTPTGESLAV